MKIHRLERRNVIIVGETEKQYRVLDFETGEERRVSKEKFATAPESGHTVETTRPTVYQQLRERRRR